MGVLQNRNSAHFCRFEVLSQKYGKPWKNSFFVTACEFLHPGKEKKNYLSKLWYEKNCQFLWILENVCPGYPFILPQRAIIFIICKSYPTKFLSKFASIRWGKENVNPTFFFFSFASKQYTTYRVRKLCSSIHPAMSQRRQLRW